MGISAPLKYTIICMGCAAAAAAATAASDRVARTPRGRSLLERLSSRQQRSRRRLAAAKNLICRLLHNARIHGNIHSAIVGVKTTLVRKSAPHPISNVNYLAIKNV